MAMVIHQVVYLLFIALEHVVLSVALCWLGYLQDFLPQSLLSSKMK